ncbi:peptidase M48 Ste24p [Halorubrum californiense DSM 19288]|uniref:Protease HtpX homolog n=1 Tax=Halorubrum californiense DSM 19288 TaxID=1227465 RepID=M0DYF7_9EURY|nr:MULTISPECIES: M48 family metalloprotease [Halorubrum]ELZ39134.1 peptidase M48 Ste24p [Halorubrum californiense DSM 19288]TKX71976.1 peptidase M48 Ste24p [Halorubrum sp. GN11GM_10-3_MGM]
MSPSTPSSGSAERSTSADAAAGPRGSDAADGSGAFGADRGLRIRILVATALVVVLPFAFVYTFVYLINAVGLPLLEWATERPYTGEVYVDPVLLAVVVLGGLAVQYRHGPRTVLRSVGARRVSPDESPELHAAVTRLAAQADLPDPDVAVVTTDLPNAFAVGTPGDGTVVVTTGLLDRLDDAELDAVIAHELSHLANRDASLMTVAWVLPTITYYLAVLASYVLYGLFNLLRFGGGGGGDRDGRALAVGIVVITASAVLTLTVSAMFWFGSVLIHRVLSRYREYAADRGAAEITGSPAALASALRTVDEAMPEVPDRDLRELDGGAEALYLAPLEARAFGDEELVSTDVFPETHPPTRERIARLRELAGEET